MRVTIERGPCPINDRPHLCANERILFVDIMCDDGSKVRVMPDGGIITEKGRFDASKKGQAFRQEAEPPSPAVRAVARGSAQP